ncbi:alginate export family protein [Polyangium sp. 15x6]|uniref:alginate export family protein n=1 Tax=Polyangium sp. 15x6 TaxID=3042687 RepID=UPI00249BC112|nr:alginate export family protein [Polyangium sp. 15x6]MDI3284085.1 alginate export family protein [Polyangium sp. 15x6]
MRSARTSALVLATSVFFGLATTPASAPRAQDVHGGERTAAPAPRYQSLRYLEDYSYLAHARGDDPFDVLKYVPLWPGGHLSIGGQHRLRYEYLAPVDLAPASAEPRESVLFVRNLLHADLVFHPQIRLFAQIGAFEALGAPARDEPPGADLLDAPQLFLEIRGKAFGVRVVARAGRQEMSLGSTRWVSARDGTNVRQSFDLARISLSGRTWKNDTFFGTVPILERGVFDDAPSFQSRFWGTYFTLALAPGKAASLDAFYLGRDRPDVTYREISGREVRHTLGVRAFGELASGFEYIVHGLLQGGTVGDASILAWGFAGGLWQRLPGAFSPLRVGVRWDALSGDSRPGDGTVSTFHPLFPNQTFFSALPAIYPTNLYEVHPLLQFERGAVSAEAGCTFFWRQAVEDAVYQPPGAPFIRATDSRAPFTAAQMSLSFGYRAARHLSFNAEYSHVFAGPAYVEAGGADVDFFGTWTTFTY